MSDASVCPYTEEMDSVMSNFDHEIDTSVAAALKEKEAFARYAGWNFNGRVWWDRNAEEWVCEVWTYVRTAGSRSRVGSSRDPRSGVQ